MSLKTRLRISIVALVTIVVVALSTLYLYDFTSLAFEAALRRSELVESQVKGYVLEKIKQELAVRNIHPATLAESKQAWTEIVRTDSAIPRMLERTLANADVVVNIHISGEDGAILASSSPHAGNQPALPTRSFEEVLHRNSYLNLWDLLTRTEDYVHTLPLGVEQQEQPIFRITTVIRSTLLAAVLRNPFRNLAVAFLGALVGAVFLAFALPSFVLNPIERLGQQIDLIRTGEGDAPPAGERQEAREFAAVQSKLSLLGQQFRGAKQDAMELRTNIEEMLQRLEEAVLLFDASGRLMMAGHPVERLLGKGRDEIVGRKVEDLFPSSTLLGAVIGDAMRNNHPVRDHIVTLDHDGAGRTRVLVNVEVLRRGDGQQEIGTLITLRDAETRRQLELQLDVSSRLAAISRLTGGVAHEIKNPLNAIALHLEVLKTKLDAADPEIEVISTEIKRLDRVVKTFLNFNKPIDLQMKALDLTTLTAEVVQLVQPEASLQDVRLETTLDRERWINGDADLLKQAVLNVVMNAIEAMETGGRLVVATEEMGSEYAIRVSDNGPGIPPDIQDKIFNLYFSTKESGSGIGLAMTFRVVQLHSGTIDFSSEAGKGTSFCLRFPALSAHDAGRVARRVYS